MLQNREDSGNCRFICVQLPELLPVPEKRLKFITNIGKQHIRNVISQLREDGEGKFDQNSDGAIVAFADRALADIYMRRRYFRYDGNGSGENARDYLNLFLRDAYPPETFVTWVSRKPIG